MKKLEHKNTIKTQSRELDFLQSLTAYFKKELFEDDLPPFIITLEKIRGAFGYATSKAIYKDNTLVYYQVAINFLLAKKNGNLEELADTLIHEMIHLYCNKNNIKEVSNNGRYHNKAFKNLAEAKGLKTIQHQTFGYNTCGLQDNLKIKIIEEITSKYDNDYLLSLFDIKEQSAQEQRQAQQEQEQDQEQEQQAQQQAQQQGTKNRNLQVYICPCCKMKVRAKNNARLLCLDCNQELILKC